MGGIAEEVAPNEEDKGPLVYQESKIFHSETFLCNVYDNTKRRYVTFEIYGLDTQDTLVLGYTYETFDKEFRFNAELMNPNRKEGRFHWVIERLAIVTVGKERRLERKPEPSEEVPELPIYETTRKIPTGRMDLKERQRLREQMDMLDIKRAENIAAKRAATKERFLEHILRVKEEDKRKKREVEEMIAHERRERVLSKEQREGREREEQIRLEAKERQRKKAVAVKEQRTEEQDEEEYRALRERWRVLDAEKAANVREQHEKKEAELAARSQAEAEEKARLEELHEKRQTIWNVRESRVKRKEAEQLKRTLAVKAELQRQERMRKERNQESLKVLHSERQPIFKEQLKRTKQRTVAQEQEKEAVGAYVEKRSIPKKVKTKGKYAKPKEEAPGKVTAPKAKGKNAKKGDKSDKSGKEEEKTEAEMEKDRTDKVLDAVEAKVRAEMAEEQRRSDLHNRRLERIGQLDNTRQDAEVKHMKQYRESYRQRQRAQEEAAAERHHVMKQRDEEREGAAERRRQEQERLQRIREHNMARKEQERLAALCA